MKITGMKTNHLTNPLGYEIKTPRVSFRVEDTQAKNAEAVRIRAALDGEFDEVIYDTGKSSQIEMIGTDLEIRLKPRTRYYWQAEVWGDNGEHAVSDTAWFETARMDEPWEGKWIGCSKLKDTNPVLVKEFTTDKTYKKSRIYITGLGLYELYLDGERVGNEYLTPGCTDYNRWIQYQTYEVQVKNGQHRLEVFLADGWYMGRFGLDHAVNNYGSKHQMTTQTAYAVALYMDFAPEGSKERSAGFLKEKLKVNKGYLKTGFVGTYLLNKVLSDYGNNELAYKLLLNEECPSWLYAVNMGATTIWERWNSILPDGKISGTEMNSLNHYSYGSVVEWMYRNMAGLHVEEEHPGFTHVTIAPQPDYRITSCAMKYQSAAGTYEIDWNVEKSGEFRLKITVPFGAGAKVVLPNTAKEPAEVSAGTYEYAYMPDVPILKVYSSKSPFSELLESETAKPVVESFIPEWRAIPAGMHDMTVEMLNDTPFVNLTPEQMEAFDTHLKNC